MSELPTDLKLYNLESVQTKKVYTLPTKKAKIIQQPQKEELKLIYICYHLLLVNI